MSFIIIFSTLSFPIPVESPNGVTKYKCRIVGKFAIFNKYRYIIISSLHAFMCNDANEQGSRMQMSSAIVATAHTTATRCERRSDC